MALIQTVFIQAYYSYTHNAKTLLHPDGRRLATCRIKEEKYKYVLLIFILLSLLSLT